MTVLKKTRTRKGAPLATFLKLGFKFGFGAVKLVKLLLIGGSLTAYTLLFTWQFAVLLVAAIFVHEATHVWVMRHEGMAVKGMYFIPLVGAVAVPEKDFPDRTVEAWVAFAGPFTGFALGLAGLAVYAVTHSGYVAAATSFIALINLFNLLPVVPLDGGRVVKSVALSVHTRLGLGLMVALLLGGAVFAVFQKLWIFVIVIPLGLIDLWIERDDYKHGRTEAKPPLSKGGRAQVLLAYAALAVALFMIMVRLGSAPGASAAMHALQG